MKSPEEMEDKVDEYAFYMTLGAVSLFIVIILLFVGGFFFNILSFIFMRG